jgi:hypothetical protein
MRSTALPVIEAAGVDLVLNGHAHDYERGTLNGVTWIITGGGGGSLDAKQQDWEHLTVYAAAHHHTRLDVDRDRIQVVATSLDGTVIDDLTLER